MQLNLNNFFSNYSNQKKNFALLNTDFFRATFVNLPLYRPLASILLKIPFIPSNYLYCQIITSFWHNGVAVSPATYERLRYSKFLRTAGKHETPLPVSSGFDPSVCCVHNVMLAARLVPSYSNIHPTIDQFIAHRCWQKTRPLLGNVIEKFTYFVE